MTEPDNTRALSEKAIRALKLTNEGRITAVWDLKREWIPYPVANSVFRKAEELLKRAPAKRLPCILVTGEPNSGKTSAHERYLEQHPIDLNLTGPATRADVIGIEINGPDIGTFYDSLLSALHAPLKVSETNAKKLHQVLEILQHVGTRQLLIDEINTAIGGPLLKQKAFLVALKYLANRLGLTILATGTDDARLALAADKQISSRFVHVFELHPWSFDDQFRRLLESFERLLPLHQASGLQEPRLARKLRDLSDGYLGDLAELLMQASVLAIKTKKEKIDFDILDKLKFKVSH